MKPIKTFKIGSRVFFENIPGFVSKDIDELCIMDEFNFKSNSLHANGLHGKDVIFYKNLSKQEFLDDCEILPMKIGKFLVPEFCEWLGVTIDDLKTLTPIINKIDSKHTYEKIIFDSYIENDGFFLTDEQRESAYQKYLENHKS